MAEYSLGKTEQDIEVVEHFALVHDVMREDESLRLYIMSPRAADFVRMIAGTWIRLNEHQLHQLNERVSVPFGKA